MLHRWDLDASSAISLQKELAAMISTENNVSEVTLIAGVDISIKRPDKTATGSAVILSWPDLEIVEVATAQKEVNFPYIPGLLSFREIPVILDVFDKLTVQPGLVIVDGQGIAHPRRIGLASHLGLVSGIPTIGCAKSRLCGTHEEPESEAGSYAWLTDKEETVGAVVRTRTAVKPVFVSPGHMVDLESSIKWILNCSRGYRLPEPTRLAHLAAGGNLPVQKKDAAFTTP